MQRMSISDMPNSGGFRMRFLPATRKTLGIAFAAAVMSGALPVAWASDHQDTPEVELNPRCDINDVYAFPGSTPDRICLVMTTSSPLTPTQTLNAGFDPDKLYQIKIDNDTPTDGVEDLVLQFLFTGDGANQTVSMIGPVAPVMAGPTNKISPADPTLEGAINTNLGSADNIQLFCGPREDPFFLDLEQFFRIIPDRKPVAGPLAELPNTPTATAFRDPGIDYLAGLNCFAIVVEMPTTRLTSGANANLGIWGTISR
jgi:hypothetical protein